MGEKGGHEKTRRGEAAGEQEVEGHDTGRQGDAAARVRGAANEAAGRGPDVITLDDIAAHLRAGMGQVKAVLSAMQ